MLSIGLQLAERCRPFDAPVVFGLLAESDGVEGQDEIAGTGFAADTRARAFDKGFRPMQSLDCNDGHGFFQALADSIFTGPTLTNVNDSRVILIG